jgi:formamidopyrimidine-DNA glycosylase
MPELPEVETIVRRLNKVLSGKIIANVEILRAKNFIGNPIKLVGKKILKVSRRAKLIRFHLPNQLNLLAHLKMTGQFIFVDTQGLRVGGGHPTQDWINDLPSKHTRVVFNLKTVDGKLSKLYFNDQRTFGWIKVMTDAEIQKEFDKYGPDINSKNASGEYFEDKLSTTGRKIKQVVMDNMILSGVGNIYACEGLNIAKIHPERPANSLNKTEAKRLLEVLKKVIDLGIKLGGTTISNYKNADGLSGKYQDQVRVYGREGEACKNCGGIIKKSKIGGRGTYFCPNCQV